VAEQVRHGVDPVAVLDRGAEAERAGPRALDVAADRAVRHLLVISLRRVARDIDERRVEREQLLDDLEDTLDGAAALGRDELLGDERPGGAGDVLGDFHAGWFMVDGSWLIVEA